MDRHTVHASKWLLALHEALCLRPANGLSVWDIFCGAGGLSLGFAARGYDVQGVDQNVDAIETYRRCVGDGMVGNVEEVQEFPATDVIVAGPPCQPWSRAGRRRGRDDAREGLPLVLRVVEGARPSVVVVENVPDLASRGRREYLDEFKRLLEQLGFVVSEHMLNAADYGVPQRRRRVFIVAVRDVGAWQCPEAWSREISVRDAIPESCERQVPGARVVSERMAEYISRYEMASGCRTPRDLRLASPARTVTVRNVAGATGDMLRLLLPDGTRRMLTVEEAARLQAFPDWVEFAGKQQSQFAQIGNAVPPLLALPIAMAVEKCFGVPGAGEDREGDGAVGGVVGG